MSVYSASYFISYLVVVVLLHIHILHTDIVSTLHIEQYSDAKSCPVVGFVVRRFIGSAVSVII